MESLMRIWQTCTLNPANAHSGTNTSVQKKRVRYTHTPCPTKCVNILINIINSAMLNISPDVDYINPDQGPQDVTYTDTGQCPYFLTYV